MTGQTFLRIRDDVQQALNSGRPVVALESTIISHGMQYPVNVATALEVEEIVRRDGAVPATVAILEGKLCVGLEPEQIDFLGKTEDVLKVSVRDIPFALSTECPGATTVAATMRIAHMAGIRVLVTGGIGGVHRGVHQTMDISADLTELTQTPMAVVSAGAKSILDIGLTLEYLETMGVPVITVGQDMFPAFYSRESNLRSPLRIDEPEAIATLLRKKWEIGLQGAVLIANPIPRDDEVPFKKMEALIAKALSSSRRKKIHGKELTPFLLQYISDQTGGKSLSANIALVKNNARLGARIAGLVARRSPS
jgi:pseudouridine-5'-phosphate glycosidase